MEKTYGQGIKKIIKAPARIEYAGKLFQKMGGKVIGTYLVMEEYGHIIVSEGPSDEMGVAYSLALCLQGNAKTTTLKAFPANDILAE